MIMSAKKSVYLQSPYFIPDNSYINAIKIAAKSGVDVDYAFHVSQIIH